MTNSTCSKIEQPPAIPVSCPGAAPQAEPRRRIALSRLTLAILPALLAHAALAASALAKPDAGVPVFVAKVQKRTLVDRVEALGTLRANESVEVTAQVTETITELHFEDGERVRKDQVLATMTSAEERAQLEEARATMVEAKAQLERARPLAKRGVSSDAVLAERLRNYETAAARYKAVESRLSDRRIAAPFAGLVGLRRISIGALVEPGTMITTVDDDSVMKLDFDIPATFLTSVKVGLPIEATGEAFGDRTFRGEISGIDSRVDPITRSITVRAMLPNPDGELKAGVLMTVEILKNEREAMVIPESAVVSLGRQNFVFVVDGVDTEKPTARRQDIETGARQQGSVEVISGLGEVDTVISDGTLKVKAGGWVKIMATDDDGEPLAKLLEKSKPPKPDQDADPARRS